MGRKLIALAIASLCCATAALAGPKPDDFSFLRKYHPTKSTAKGQAVLDNWMWKGQQYPLPAGELHDIYLFKVKDSTAVFNALETHFVRNHRYQDCSICVSIYLDRKFLDDRSGVTFTYSPIPRPNTNPGVALWLVISRPPHSLKLSLLSSKKPSRPLLMKPPH